MTIEQMYASCRECYGSVTLRHGRWYAVTLRDGTSVILCAIKRACFWTLSGERDAPPYALQDRHVYADAAWLCVQADGSFDRDDTEVPEDTDPVVRISREDLSVRDLVPADDRARAVWEALFGRPAACPRCGATSGSNLHHPLCHTGDGVPLLPTFGPAEWRRHVASFDEEWELSPEWDDEGDAADVPDPA